MRKEDWPHLLAEKIAECRERKFSYGSFDCFLFAAECVETMTGIDHSAPFKGYVSKIDAYKIIAGFGSFEAMVTSILKIDPKSVAFARRGDIVLAEIPLEGGETGEAVGICDGVFSWFASPNGVGHFKTMSAKLAWSID